MYVWKGRKAWELAIGNTPQEAANAMSQYFENQKNPDSMELVGQLHGENRSVCVRISAPLLYQKLVEDLQLALSELYECETFEEYQSWHESFAVIVGFAELVDKSIYDRLKLASMRCAG